MAFTTLIFLFPAKDLSDRTSLHSITYTKTGYMLLFVILSYITAFYGVFQRTNRPVGTLARLRTTAGDRECCTSLATNVTSSSSSSSLSSSSFVVVIRRPPTTLAAAAVRPCFGRTAKTHSDRPVVVVAVVNLLLWSPCVEESSSRVRTRSPSTIRTANHWRR
jgi:hypothetical protein